MKKIVMIVFGSLIVLAFAACGGSSNRTNEEADSLRAELSGSLANVEDLNLFLDAVKVSLDSVVNMEGGILRVTKESPKSSKEQIKDNIEAFKLILAQQHQRITELEEKLKNGGEKNTSLLNIIKSLKKQLEEKDQAIVELTEELDKRNFDINTLKSHVDKLNTHVAQLKEEKKEQETALERQSDMMNEAYVLIGTKKELKAAGVLSGGTMFKKTKLDISHINTASFKKIDIRKTKQFTIPSKKYDVLSQMPVSAYTVSDKGDGTSVLTVTDAARFWSVSNYLIIKY